MPLDFVSAGHAVKTRMNSTLTDVPDVGSTPVADLPTVYKTYTATDFLIGLFICLGALAPFIR